MKTPPTPHRQTETGILRCEETTAVTAYRTLILEQQERIAELVAHVERLRIAGNNLYDQLSYFMEGDSCFNDPYISWPDTCEDGCTHCSCEADMAAWEDLVE